MKSLILSVIATVAVVVPSAHSTWLPPAEPGVWPVRARIIRVPVIPHPNWRPGHRGLDVQAHAGLVVRAPVAGTVVWQGEINQVPALSLQSIGGVRHTLIPVDATVGVGDQVAAGQAIATIHASGHCPLRTCLHWSARWQGQYVDPRWVVRSQLRRLSPRW